MKRAQLVEPKKIAVDVVDIPPAPPGGLVVKMVYSGICHSDMHQWEDFLDYGDRKIFYSKSPNVKLPLVPGHEMSGLVHMIGPNQSSDELKIGDRVVVFPWRGCGKCGKCKHKERSWCDERHHCFGFDIPGGFASFVVVPESELAVKVPDSIPLDIACMLPCSGITTYNAVTTIKPVVEDEIELEGKASVLIVGAGGLGLWCLQSTKALLPSATRIIVADISEEKLIVARESGCDDTMLWSSDSDEDEIIKQTKNKAPNGGFNVVIDLVNSQITSERVFQCLLPRGVMVMVGLFGGAAKFSLPQIVLGARRIQGVHVGRLQHLKELVSLVAKTKLIPPPLRYFKLEEVEAALQLIKDGKMKGRGIIKFE